VRLGLFLSLLGGWPEAYAGVVGAAQVVGLDSVWVPDHVLKVFGPVLDPLTPLAFLAGSTSRTKLGTGVLVLPYRHPVVLANVASTLDVLSGGRFVLGAGAGWNAAEFEALGMGVGERGRRTDEILECLQSLWSGEKSSFSSRVYSFSDAQIGTRPHTPGGSQVLVGGNSEAALRRTLRFAKGWMGFRDDPHSIRRVRDDLHRLSQEQDRDPEELEIETTINIKPQAPNEPRDTAQELIESLGQLKEAGASFCALSLSTMTRESPAWVAEEIAPNVS
jgi:probable F420-dependent oxidoreductase